MHALAHIDRDMCHTPRPHHHHHQPFDASVPIFFRVACIVIVASGQPSSAAQRQHGRRLRAMLRHEEQSIAMVLAAALHHSAGPWEKKVEMQQNAALRGQTTGTRAREEVVNATHDALREQNTPIAGVRQGILAEPGLQRSDRSRRHSSGDGMPTLALPSLAGRQVKPSVGPRSPS